MGKGAKPPTSSETQSIRQFRVQSSTYGAVIPICYGQVRIAGNLLWANGFHADDLNQPSGGAKGGRVSIQQFSYSVSVILGLCEGPVIGLGRAYIGDSPQADAPQNSQTGRPLGAAPYLTKQQPSCWRMKRVVGVTEAQYDPTAGFWQFGDYPMVLGTVPASIPNTATGHNIVRNHAKFVGSQDTRDFTTHANDPGGTPDQYWDILVDRGPNGQPTFADTDTDGDPSAITKGTQALTYPGIAYIAGHKVNLDSQASLPNFNFPVIAFAPYSWLHGAIADAELIADLQTNAKHFDDNDNPVIQDALCTDIAYDLLTETRYGVGWPTSYLADLYGGPNSHATYCKAFGIWFSPVYDQQRTAADILTELAELSNSAWVWSEGRLKLIPYGDELVQGAQTGTIYDPFNPAQAFTPVGSASPDGAFITARYALDDDAFLREDAGDDPVEIRRTPPTDVYTSQSVEFLARGRGYRQETAQATDAAGIATESGAVREANVKQAHMICSRRLARDTAQRLLQRQIAIRNTYTFRLGWRYCLLEPMDVVTLTDAALGLVAYPVRITSVEEDEHGALTIEAEDLPVGTATAVSYTAPGSRMGGVDFNVPPGLTRLPIIFEPIYPLATEPELWIAASGIPATWGGAAIYMAETEDGDYVQVGTLNGRAAHGPLLDALPLVASPDTTSNVRVQMFDGGTLSNGTATDAAGLHRLLYVGHGNTYELVSHSTATLLSTDPKLALSIYRVRDYLVRGAYGTVPQAWSAGTPVLRLDSNIARIPLPTRLLGKSVYLKLVPLNVYGALVVGIEDVAPIYHFMDGTWWLTPPADVTGTHVTFLDGYAQLQWDRIENDPRAGQLEYEVRYGPAWATASVLGRTKDTRFVIRGTGTFWVAATVTLETGLVHGRSYSENPDSVIVTEATQAVDFFREVELAEQGWPGDVEPYPLGVWALEPQSYLRFCDGANLGHDSAGFYEDGDGGVTVAAGATRAAALLPVTDVGRTGALACAGTAAAVILHDLGAPIGDIRRYQPEWSVTMLVKRAAHSTDEVLFSCGATALGWRVLALSSGAIRIARNSTAVGLADSGITPFADTAVHRLSIIQIASQTAYPALADGFTTNVIVAVEVDGVFAALTVLDAFPAGPLAFPGYADSGSEHPLTGTIADVAYYPRQITQDEVDALEAAYAAAPVGGLTVDRLAGTLRLAGLSSFDSIPNVDAAATIDYFGGIATSGVFLPDAGNVRQVLSARTSTRPYLEIDAAPFLPYDVFDDIPVVDDEAGIDAVDSNALATTIEFAPGLTGLADDRIGVNPAYAKLVPYETFRPYRAGTLSLQRLRWRFTLAATTSGVAAECTRLLLGCDALSRRETGSVVAIGPALVTSLGTAAGVVDSATPLVLKTIRDVPVGEQVVLAIASAWTISSQDIDVSDSSGNTWTVCARSSPSTSAPAVVLMVATIAGATLGAGSTITIRRPNSLGLQIAATATHVAGLATGFPSVTQAAGVVATSSAAHQTLTAPATGVLPAAPALILAIFGITGNGGDVYTANQGAVLPSAHSPGSVSLAPPGLGGISAIVAGQQITVSTTASVTPSGVLDAIGGTASASVVAVFTLAAGAQATTITFARPFNGPPSVQVMVRDAQAGDTVTVTSVTASTFAVLVRDAVNAVAARTIDWIASGD